MGLSRLCGTARNACRKLERVWGLGGLIAREAAVILAANNCGSGAVVDREGRDSRTAGGWSGVCRRPGAPYGQQARRWSVPPCRLPPVV